MKNKIEKSYTKKLKKHINKKVISICIVLIAFCVYGIIDNKLGSISKNINSQNTISVSSNVNNLSTKKISWGLKRGEKNEQPKFADENFKILNQYDGITIGNKDTKKVYLTFDEGYEAGYTSKILDILKENDIKAAFFITGHYLDSEEELIRRMIDEGNIVGNHSVNHKSFAELNEEEIKKEVQTLHTSMYEKFNYEMKYIRPPKGEFNERSIAITNNLGYTTVMWSFAYDDWDEKHQKGEEFAKSKILDNLHNGEVILLHANSKDNSDVLNYCIKEIKSRGYFFESLDNFEK